MAIKISKNRVDMGSTPIKNVSYQDLDQVATQAAPATGKTRFYSKTDGALYVVPAAGAETAVIPANLVAHTTATSAPSGWSDLSVTYGGRAIVAMPSGGTNGATVLSPLTDAQSPTHTHTYTDVIAHIHTAKAKTDLGTSLFKSSADTGSEGFYPTTSTGIATGTTAATAAHLPYVQLRMIKKS